MYYLLLLIPSLLLSAPPPQDTLSYLRHQCQNNEQELFMLQQRVQNQEAIIDSVRDELQRMSTKPQEKTSALYPLLDALTKDVENIQKQEHTTKSIVKTMEKELLSMKTLVEEQKKELEYLRTSLKTLLSAVQEEPSSSTYYVVQPGDSLGKIAQKYNTTIKDLKSKNRLEKDQIFSGQKLLIKE